jgi:hypothetical protein
MRISLLSLLISLFSNFAYSQTDQATKQREEMNPQNVTLLDAGRVYLNRKVVKTVHVKYAANVDLNKEISFKDYLQILEQASTDKSNQYILNGLKLAVQQIYNRQPDRRLIIPQEITVFDCGTCGVGYISYTKSSICWCASCPK